MSNSVASVFSAGLAFLTAWTVSVHAVTLGTLPFHTLYAALAVAVVAAIAGARAGWAIAQPFDPGQGALPTVTLHWPALGAIGRTHLALAGLLAAAFTVAAGLQYFKSSFIPLMLVCMATASVALFTASRNQELDLIRLRPVPSRSDVIPTGAGFLFLTALILAFYILTSAPDTDDAFFLNMAVGAIHDRGAVMAHDTMLGVPGLEMMRSTYRLEAYTLLSAVIADLTGIKVILAAHTVLPCLTILFATSILTLLHRALFAQAWLVTALLHLAVLVALDGGLTSYGYHAVPRFFHGKGPFVMVIVPLIAFLAIQSIRLNSWAALLTLAATILVGIGMTANALYVGLLAAALAAAPLFLLGPWHKRCIALRLLLITVYPVVLAIYLLAFDPPSASEFIHTEPIGAMVWAQFGPNYILALTMMLLAGASSVALFGRNLTLISLYVLIVLLAVLNPLVWPLYADYVTGNINIRLFWAIPFPMILAIMAGMAWRSLPLRYAIAVPAIAVLAMAGSGSILRHIEIKPSLIKVTQPAYDIATEINTTAPESGLILAPEALSAWIATLDDARPLVEGRVIYLPLRQNALPPDIHDARDRLFRWVDGLHGLEMPLDQAMPLADSIDVSVIAVRHGTQAHDAMTAGAAAYGFEQQLALTGYTVFQRVSRP